MTRPFVLSLFCYIAFTGVSCAPRDNDAASAPAPGGDQANRGGDAQPRDTGNEKGAQDSEDDQQRIDAARAIIRQRHPLTSHGFWTVFHYILGVGPHNAMLRDEQTGQLVNAVEYICQGEPLRGLAFAEKPDGTVDVITQAGGVGVGQGHQDQFVAEMVQWGMSKDKVFMVNGKKHTFADFILHSKMHASLTKRQELSWAVLIIAEHYGTDHKWVNNFKEAMSLEKVVNYEISEPINPTTTCGGTHRLFDLTWVYHRHRQNGGKKEGVWRACVDYLEKYKKYTKAFQNADGTFSTKYVTEPGNDPETELRINTTGHVLEWLSLYLSDAELREPWVRNAVVALTDLIRKNANRTFDGGSYYHAAHALEIYRTRLFGAADAHPPVFPPVPKD